MSSCWSCLVIVEEGSAVCPLCGADQTRPVILANPSSPQPYTKASFFHEWGIFIVVIFALAASFAGILIYNFGGHSISPASQAAEVAAKSLRELRETLSSYAISAKDTYPATLDSLGGRVSLPMQAAQIAGYDLQYSPNPSLGGSTPRGFVILARPRKGNYPSLCIDESGVVRATLENRTATVQDPPL
jgi:hypothetical protein